MKIVNYIVPVLLHLFLIFTQVTFAQQKAFPGAEGFGAYTTGGRGGKVVKVTNLNDSGVGSLRYALEDVKGARTVVFEVSGYIELESRLKIKNDSVTVAGQTAPGDGICTKNYTVEIDADEVIIRFIRFRLGDEAQQEADSFWGREHKNIIIDHCTMSWSIDECASFYDNVNFTMQWCLISESLNNSYHSKGEHGYGGIWGGMGATFHHNLFAHHTSRNPRFNGARYTSTPETELVDFANNVIYNWESNSAYGGEGGRVNIRNNFYKSGPATKNNVAGRIIEPYDETGNWYVNGNYVEGFPDITADNWNGGVQGTYAAIQKEKKAEEPFPAADITLQTAEEAFYDVVRYAGVLYPVRDTVDKRVLEEVLNGTGYSGTDAKGIIDSQEDVGGYPELKSSEPPADSDNDGMPDFWEAANGLDPSDGRDRNNTGMNGYTELENYLNALAEGAVTGIEDVKFSAPEDFVILNNYPNPFNPATRVNYSIPERGRVEICIYSIEGSLVEKSIVNDANAGLNTYEWTAGNETASGVYIIVLRYNSAVKSVKTLLLK